MAICLPRRALICAARHFIAAHKSACTGKPVVWGQDPCGECPEVAQCRCDWTTVLRPLFDAAGVSPEIVNVKPVSKLDTGKEGLWK